MIPPLLVAALLLPFGGGAHRKAEQGNQLYREGEFDGALRSYTEAQVGQPEAPELFYDIGNVLYRQGDFEGAAAAYSRALLSAPESLVGPAAHNLGNARYQLKDYDDAVDAYQRALRADPAAVDSKRNLELALRALAQKPQDPQSQKQGGDRKKPEQQESESQASPPEKSDGAESPKPGAGQPEKQDSPPQDGKSGEPAGAEKPGEDRRPTPGSGPGEMTAEQAEHLLDGLNEQELNNLRDQALRQHQPVSKSPEVDW